jgi:hypothetical protein
MPESLADIRNSKEAENFYYNVIRHLDHEAVYAIENNPSDLPGDDDKVRAAKAAYRKLQEFGHGCVDMRRRSHAA